MTLEERKIIRDERAIDQAIAAFNNAPAEVEADPAAERTILNLWRIWDYRGDGMGDGPAEIARRLGVERDMDAARDWWTARMRGLYGEAYRLVFDRNGLLKEYRRADLDSGKKDISALLADDDIWEPTIRGLMDNYPRRLEARGGYPWGGGPETDEELVKGLYGRFWDEFGTRPYCMPEDERQQALCAVMSWVGERAITFDVLS